VNDPDQTMGLPVVELSREPNGTSARGAFVPKDTIIPPKNPMSHPTITADPEPIRWEPTVFSAIRRYRVMVIAIAILAMVAAAAYTALEPKVYRAEANVTVPLPPSSPAAQADPAQYLDDQVVAMQSQGVAQQAADIANSQLGSNTLTPSDFDGSNKSLNVNPPTTATPGGYGASIIAVSFQGPSAEIAQVGLGALLQAFDDAWSGSIKAETNATIAGIHTALASGLVSANQEMTQHAQAIVNEQADLGRPPTAAIGPATRANGHWALYGVIGLVAGAIVGAALAYALAIRRPSINGRDDPAVIYGVPMIAEIPAFKARDGLPPVYAEPYSAVAEAFRFAAGSVERICAAQGTQVSLAFCSPLAGPGKSTVVANLALAMAEGGTRLLVVDADAADGGVTARLLPGVPITAGFEQALGDQRALADCVQASPFSEAIAVLGSGPAARQLVTGPARSRPVRALLADARASFDVVLIDSPGALEMADAADLASAADAAIIVVNLHDRIADHVETARRLKANGSDVIGYLYNQAQIRLYGTGDKRNGWKARPDAKAAPSLAGVRTSEGESGPSSEHPGK
jgi:Mrp family chromosome partitioning ATPase